MKTCPQCGQTYFDDTNFCLSDGATLIGSESAPTVAQIEMPTMIRSVPAVIQIETPVQPSFQQPFQMAIPPPAQTPSDKGSRLLYMMIGVVLFVILGVGAGIGVYLLSRPGNGPENSSNKPKTDSGAIAGEKKDDQNDGIDAEKEKLKADQEQLEREKKRLEDERKALEAQKKLTPTPIVPPADTSRTAYIVDPPSNIRATPNGRIICVIRGVNTPVRILGSSGVRDNNGVWYFTDACGQRGLIHSTQIRF
jgi:hypothetical protein